MPRKLEFNEAELLEKAVNLFWRKGYHATSAQDLVDELGINRSSLYNTYTDKRTLFKKALKLYQQQQTGALIAELAVAGDAEQALREIFEDLVQQSAGDNLLKGCFMVNTSVEMASSDAEIAAIVNQNNQSVIDALTAVIEKGQQAGQISKNRTASAFARFLFGAINAMRVAARTGASFSQMQEQAGITLDSLKVRIS